MTPSLKIDSVSTIPILNVGDTIQVEFSVYAKLKIESEIVILSLGLKSFPDKIWIQNQCPFPH